MSEPTIPSSSGGFENPSRRLGAYALIREIGRGGMATVYLARRADEEFERQVAIKVLHRSLEDGGDRLLLERQILAKLDHPHITRLLDGGTTEEGQPYLVMEYVRGLEIDRYCDQHRLSLKRRLELFEAVCFAVHFAHRNLTIHRDLKPAHVLVTDRGEPKLLDFGIAKLLDAPSGSASPPSTSGLHPMTPAYASPEQIQGLALSTATDTYSLGVLLYRLLTGTLPFDYGEEDRSFSPDLLRRICEEPPLPPSAAVARQEGGESAMVARELRGDLDRIVLKAMRKEPDRRYSSAQALGEDVRRHLEGHPVEARDPGRLYRTAKFVRRHRWGVAAAVVLFVLLVSFLVVVLELQAVTAEERDRAEATSEFLQELFRSAEPGASGEELTARELLDRGVQDIQGKFIQHPQVRATLLITMGRAFLTQGYPDAARPLFAEALELRRALHGSDHAEVAEALEVLAYAHYHEGRFQQAEALFRESLATAVRLFGEHHPETAEALKYLGVVLRDQGRYREAEEVLRPAIAMLRELHGASSTELSDGLFELANLLQLERRLGEAETLIREALELDRELRGERHPFYVASLDTLGRTLFVQGKVVAAEETFGRCLALARELLESGHPHLAVYAHNLARARDALGDWEGAEPLYREALSIYRSVNPDHVHIGETLLSLTPILMARDDYGPARQAILETLRLKRQSLGEGHLEVISAQIRLAAIEDALGHPGEVQKIVQEVLGKLDRLSPEGPASRMIALDHRAWALLHRRGGDLAAAEHNVRELIALGVEHYGPEHVKLANHHKLLGRVLHRLGRHSEAEEAFDTAAQIYRERRPKGHHDIAKALSDRAAERLDLARFEAAERDAREAREIFLSLFEGGSFGSCRASVLLAESLLGQGETATAAEVLAGAERHLRAEEAVRRCSEETRLLKLRADLLS